MRWNVLLFLQRLKYILSKWLFNFFLVGLIFCCFNSLIYLPEGRDNISASTREETEVSGDGKNEFTSEEHLELSGTVQVHHHIPLGLAGTDIDAFSHPPKHSSSVSSITVFFFSVAMPNQTSIVYFGKGTAPLCFTERRFSCPHVHVCMYVLEKSSDPSSTIQQEKWSWSAQSWGNRNVKVSSCNKPPQLHTLGM